MCTPTHATPTFITEVHYLVTHDQVATADLSNCYRELMPYTVLDNSYLVSFHDTYQFQGHAH